MQTQMLLEPRPTTLAIFMLIRVHGSETPRDCDERIAVNVIRHTHVDLSPLVTKHSA